MTDIQNFLTTYYVKTGSNDDRIKSLDALELYNTHNTPITITRFGTALNKYLKDNNNEIKKWKIGGIESRGFIGYKSKKDIEEQQNKMLIQQKTQQTKIKNEINDLIEILTKLSKENHIDPELLKTALMSSIATL
jgi:hypothetical protein